MRFYNNAGRMVQTTKKKELHEEIKIRLDRGQYNLNDIDTSKITDMNHLFYLFRKYDLSKIDISKWDVSSVEDMGRMFYNCPNFNSDLSKWNVSNVYNMSNMFDGCTRFNCDLSGWDTSSAVYMDYMLKDTDIDEKPEWY